jgi:hypothetical protein
MKKRENSQLIAIGPGALGNLVAGPCLVKVWTQELAKLDHVEDDGGVEQKDKVTFCELDVWPYVAQHERSI